MNKTIVLIDDNTGLAETLSEVLQLKSYSVLAAHTGNDGVMLALTEQPDVIIVDYRLPDIDGFEVIRQIQADAWGATARFLMLSSAITPEQIPSDIELTPADILNKVQWGIENLHQKIEEKLGNG